MSLLHTHTCFQCQTTFTQQYFTTYCDEECSTNSFCAACRAQMTAFASEMIQAIAAPPPPPISNLKELQGDENHVDTFMQLTCESRYRAQHQGQLMKYRQPEGLPNTVPPNGFGYRTWNFTNLWMQDALQYAHANNLPAGTKILLAAHWGVTQDTPVTYLYAEIVEEASAEASAAESQLTLMMRTYMSTQEIYTSIIEPSLDKNLKTWIENQFL